MRIRQKMYEAHDIPKNMPVCPKCGKLISAKKYKRHLSRHGQTHKHGPTPIRHPENFYMNV